MKASKVFQREKSFQSSVWFENFGGQHFRIRRIFQNNRLSVEGFIRIEQGFQVVGQIARPDVTIDLTKNSKFFLRIRTIVRIFDLTKFCQSVDDFSRRPFLWNKNVFRRNFVGLFRRKVDSEINSIFCDDGFGSFCVLFQFHELNFCSHLQILDRQLFGGRCVDWWWFRQNICHSFSGFWHHMFTVWNRDR